MANLAAAVKAARDPKLVASFVEEMETVNAQLAMVKRHLEPREASSRADLRAVLEHRVDDWKHAIRQHPLQARQVLSHLLDGPITINPEEAVLDGDVEDTRGKEGITDDDLIMREQDFKEVSEAMRSIAGLVVWTATTRPAGLLVGLPGSERMASPTGFEPVFWP